MKATIYHKGKLVAKLIEDDKLFIRYAGDSLYVVKGEGVSKDSIIFSGPVNDYSVVLKDETVRLKCISNSHEDNNYPLIVDKIYVMHNQDDCDFWVKDERGFIEHYDRDLFEVLEDKL